MQAEASEFGIDVAFVHALDRLLGFEPVADQVGDRADLEPVLRRERFELGTARHGAVVAHDFDEHASRRETRERGEIARRFGVTGARKHATGLRGERKDVAGLHDVVGARIGFGRDADRLRAIVCRDAGRDAGRRFDRHGEVRMVRRRVAIDHGLEAQLPAMRLRQRQADETATFAHHEVDVLWPHFFGGHDEIAFVFAVFVVEDHDHAAGTDLGEDFGDRREAHACTPRSPYNRST